MWSCTIFQKTKVRYGLVLLALVLLSSSQFLSADKKTSAKEEKSAKSPASTGTVSFYKQIRPIFQANCHGCHQPAKPNGEYSMTNFAKMLAGGESGDAAVVPGKSAKSYLMELITPDAGEAEMPKGKKPLSKVEIGLIKTWIDEGAKDDTPADAHVRYDAKNLPQYTMPPVITSLDYSPDGKLIAVAGFHEVLLHKADGSGLVARLVGMSERIESVKFSPDGKRLAVTGGMPSRLGELQVWDVATRKLTLSIPITYDVANGGSWSPDGTRIAVGCMDNTVRAFDSKTGKQLLFQGAHNGWVVDTVFSVEGSHIISVGGDRTAKLTEFATQRFVDNVTSITPGALKGGLEAIDRHPKADAILIGGADGVPKLYRIFRQTKRVIGDDANLIRRFPAMRGRIFDVAISRDGKVAAAVSSLDNTGQLRVYGFDFSLKLPAKLKKVAAKRAAQRSAEEKRKLKSYQVKDVKPISDIAVKNTGLYAVAIHPNGKAVAVAGSDGKVRLYDTATRKLVKAFIPVPMKPQSKIKVARRSIGARPEPALDPESLHAEDKLVSIQVYPEQAELKNAFENIQLMVMGKTKSGTLVDVTRMVEVSGANGNVEVSPRRRIRGLKNGKVSLTLSIQGKSVQSVVKVQGIGAEYHPQFAKDVMPVLSRVGCNLGTCHGANKGKGGFKLSLRGTDPVFDVRAFTDDHASRRVSVASPDNSLMLLKAIGEVPHLGGQVTRPGEPYYEIIRKWIADGVKLDMTVPRVTGIKIFPKNPVVQRVGGKQQFRVLARYSNGEIKDVTAESSIKEAVKDIAFADEAGLVTALRRGESPVLARYEGAYAATIMTVMGNRKGFVWKQPTSYNFIDDLVAKKLELTKTLPSEVCTDAEYIRRVSLDLTGLPPSADQVRKFLADKRPSRIKRDALVKQLIGNEEFVDYWTNKWADMLLVNRKYLGAEGSKAFRQWIRNEVTQNTPYDKFAYKILTASGSNLKNPAASYYKIHRKPEETMENTTHLFLAIRFSCNKCHDHPFEKWAQDQYYETAAYFARIGLKKDPASGKRQIGRTAVEAGKPLYEIVYEKPTGEVSHVRTGRVTPPKFPYDVKYTQPKKPSRREHLARWVTSKNNPYFAKSYVNRVWAYLTGVGLIEPIDDIRAGNPPTNPVLLDRLTAEFINSNFNVRHLMQTICTSRTYQLSIKSNRWNEDDGINYSHALARRLPAEVIFDALHQVTGSVSKIPGVKPGTRAAQLPDSGVKLASGFLTKFGRPARESACECERSTGMQLGPIMALVSGPTVGNAINDPQNSLAKLAATKMSEADLIKEIFIRILNRPATKQEISAGVAAIKSLPGEHQALISELRAYEKKLEPGLQIREKAHQQDIVKADAALKAYTKKIAPRETKLNNEQKARTAKLAAALQKYERNFLTALKAWEAKMNVKTVWKFLEPSKLTATAAGKLIKQKDKSILATGVNKIGEYRLESTTDLTGLRAIRLEVLTDKRLPKNGPGRAPDGNFVLTELELFAAPKSDPTKKVKLKLVNAQADFSQAVYNVKTAIDGSEAATSNGWALAPQMGKNHVATFEFQKLIGHKIGTIITVVMKQRFSSRVHNIGKFRLSVTNSAGPILLKGPPTVVAAILAIPPAKRNKKQSAQLLQYFRSLDGRLKSMRAAVANSKKPRPADPELTRLANVLKISQQPLPIDPQLAELRRAVGLSEKQLVNPRLTVAQDLAWALINSPSFLFNR